MVKWSEQTVRKMRRSTHFFLTSFLILFFSVQFYLTIFGGFLWPFSSHRLFSQLPRTEKSIVQAVLEDVNGNSYTVHPGKVIPIEFCRCSGLIRNLHENGTEKQKKLFVDYLIARLNEKPWWAFDEMYSSVNSQDGASFIKLGFEVHKITFSEGIQVKERRVMFQ